MYVLKTIPQDFIVKERSNVEIKKEGQYTYFLLKKTDYNTLKALQTVANVLHYNIKDFGYAGNKDKKAITEQLCSVKGNPNLEHIKLTDIEVKEVGKGDKPISLGDLEGNEFTITIRNIEKLPEKKEEFTNYFGEQRFGRNNVEVGRAIVKGDFKKAAELAEVPSNNPVISLKTINKKLLRLYIHAYQSFLWNKMVEKYPKETVPLVGFGTEIKEGREFLEEEGITERDFIIRAIPDLSAEGIERKVNEKAENLIINKLEDDEQNEGKKKTTLTFFLKKGCYATVFIKQLLQES